MSWKLSRTVLRGAGGGNAARLLDQKLNTKTKQPFAIAMKDGQPYALAGLWEKRKDREAGTELLTFTVITTDPNEVVRPMHDRMPVIIPERDYDRWLQPGDLLSSELFRRYAGQIAGVTEKPVQAQIHTRKLHSLLHAGLARRTELAIMHSLTTDSYR